ncbi:2OG-Fe(II) oxygenase family protein [Pseudoalteromonas sp. DL2-H2.2]|uniref:putative 2OG-Fe(II) oxygenase n=1 Tax=Pseudoalteromonas TaxID=53246 RepID=UPI000697033E|nr:MULTISPECIES: putative 2OG-Fe(II) oxygenase [Pseudoalteromonas]MCF2907879.1 2OG-Fe(II) oxygenase family protein [Pseudoalteromonas sp. DL2-H2.2]
MKINAKPRICFATPVLEGELTGVEELNKGLTQLFFSLEKEGYRNLTRINTTQGDIYDSPGDLFSLTHYPEIAEIKQHMNGVLTSWILETGKMTRAELSQLHFEIESWFHITRYGGTKTLHDHGQCSWSMIYYVDAGDPPPPEFPRSGFLQIYDPRRIQMNPYDKGFSNFKPTFDYGGFSVAPYSGKFVVFPGYLQHEVLTYFGNKPRIMIAINCLIRERT